MGVNSSQVEQEPEQEQALPSSPNPSAAMAGPRASQLSRVDRSPVIETADDDLAASQLLSETLQSPVSTFGITHNGITPLSKRKRSRKPRLSAERVRAATSLVPSPAKKAPSVPRNKDRAPQKSKPTSRDDAPGPLDALFEEFPTSPVATQRLNGHATDDVMVPNTPSRFTAVNGQRSPDTPSGIIPSSSAAGGTGRATRGKTRKSYTVDLSDQVEPLPVEDDAHMVDIEEQFAGPKKQKRKRSRKSQLNSSLPADTNGDSGARDNGDHVEASAPQKRRRLGLSQSQSVDGGAQDGPERIFGTQIPRLENGAMDVDEEPVLPANLLQTLKAKRRSLANTNGTNGDLSEEPERAPQSDVYTVDEADGRFAREVGLFLASQDGLNHAGVGAEAAAPGTANGREEALQTEEPIYAEEAVQTEEAVEPEPAPPKKQKKKKKRTSQLAEPEEPAASQDVLPAPEQREQDLPVSNGWVEVESATAPFTREEPETQILKSQDIPHVPEQDEQDEQDLSDFNGLVGIENATAPHTREEPQTETLETKKKRKRKRKSAAADETVQPEEPEPTQEEQVPSATKKRAKKRRSRVVEDEEDAEPEINGEAGPVLPEVAAEAEEVFEAFMAVSPEIAATAREKKKRKGRASRVVDAEEEDEEDDGVEAGYYIQVAEENDEQTPDEQAEDVQMAEDDDEQLPQEQPEKDVQMAEAPRKKRKGRASRVVDAEEEDEQAPEEDIQVEESPKRKRKRRESRAVLSEEDDGEAPEDEVADTPKSRRPRRKSTKTVDASERENEDAQEDAEVTETPKKKRKKRESKTPKSAKTKSDTPTARRPRTHLVGAEAELNKEHRLGNPPDLRDSGEFTADEAELVRQVIKQYQFRHDLSVADLVRLIQFTKPYGAASRRDGHDVNGDSTLESYQIKCSTEFWREVYDTLPRRKAAKAKGGTTGIQRFVRRKYHGFKGAGGWDADEDEMLAKLARAHPGQWKKISFIMGDRGEDACRDRWRNYVQYGTERNAQTWSDHEEAKLFRAVAAVTETLRAARSELGRPELEEYTSRDINWQLVSEKVGTRSRLQCAQKWKLLQEAGGVGSSTPRPTPGSRNKKRSKKETKETDVSDDAASPPPQHKPKAKPKPKSNPKSTLTHDKMLWGDKLDVLAVLSDCGFTTLESIDWAVVAANAERSASRPNYTPWPTETRKAALKELLELVEGEVDVEAEGLPAALDAIAVVLGERFGGMVEEFYVPSPGELAGVGEGGRKGKAKVVSRERVTVSDDEL